MAEGSFWVFFCLYAAPNVVEILRNRLEGEGWHFKIVDLLGDGTSI